ncbi:MAG: LacI family DNA-binding transcriptional regulator [Oscillospiraceae bacterium]|nr:LacI family DNA-binding transcriptional regulator [Oscillospiraceae bacterium]
MDIQSAKKITINQVAEYCGVSKTTISRFLNGKYENMSEETKDKISSAIKELNYRPDRSAQRLKSSKTMLIGCVVGDVSSPFSALLLRGIFSVCEEAGFQVLLADSHENAQRERKAIQGFIENRVDGLIINSCGENDDYILSLREHGIPMVLADRPLASPGLVDTVSSSNKATAEECVRFLFEQGYSAVAFFTQKMGHITPRLLRCEGYKSGIEEHGVSGSKAEIYEFENKNQPECERHIKAFIAKHPGEHIAILVSNGTSAQTVLCALNTLGIKVGSELGLCTFDDWDWLEISSPGITAVALGSVEIGAKSAQLLIDTISGKRSADTPADILVDSKLTIKESTPGPKG